MGEIVKLIVNIQMRATEQLQDGSNFWFCGLNVKIVTIKMKDMEQYFPVVPLACILHVLFSLWMKLYYVTIQMGTPRQYFRLHLCATVFYKMKEMGNFLEFGFKILLKSNSFLVLFSNWLIYYSSLVGVCQVQASLGMGTQ